MSDKHRFETLAVHAGQSPDPTTGAVMTPVYLTSTYAQAGPGEHKGFEYSRTRNPTRDALEACLAALEGAAHGLAFASGLAATDAILHLLDAGDHLVCSDDVYGGTFRLVDKVFRRHGLEASFVDLADPASLERAMRPRTRLVWIESPTNPLLKLVDLQAAAAAARARGAITVVDNTFATPFFQRPLAHGIDLVCQDISKPLGPKGGAIVEVNAGPSLLMHIKPGIGKPRPVGQAIVNNLFAEGLRGRVPLVGITGSRGKTAVARMLSHLIHLSGSKVGTACSDGIFLGTRQVQKTNAAHWEGGRRLLLNRAVEAAVIENGARVILGEGLAYDRCAVGVVTNFIDGAEDLSRWDVQPTGGEYYTTPRSIFRTQVDVVLRDGHAVLNAEDELVADFAELCDGEVIFFATDPAAPAMAAHLTKGGRGVYVSEGRITLAKGSDAHRLCRLGDSPVIGKAKRPQDIANVLAAVAAGWALGLSEYVLKTGVKTWGLDLPDPSISLVDYARSASAKTPRK